MQPVSRNTHSHTQLNNHFPGEMLVGQLPIYCDGWRMPFLMLTGGIVYWTLSLCSSPERLLWQHIVSIALDLWHQ